jgi:hypothetical protein
MSNMLARTPASQRARFLKSIGVLDANPPPNTLHQSNALDEAERSRRIQGSATAVNALRSLSPEAQSQATNAKLPKTEGGDDMTGIFNTPMTMDEMMRKLSSARG